MSEINDFHVIWRVLKTVFEVGLVAKNIILLIVDSKKIANEVENKLQMCSDRGYMVSHLFLDETLEEFKEKNNNV